MHLLAGSTVHNELVVLQVHFEGAQVSVVDAQHASLQLEL